MAGVLSNDAVLSIGVRPSNSACERKKQSNNRPVTQTAVILLYHVL
jgi:hypothetical protein